MMFRNPVLQRELTTNLRRPRAFLVFAAYVCLVGAVVYLAWPASGQIVLNDTQAKRLFDLFVIGQFVLVGMLAPAFTAESISGEKERKTYEMLLASPLRPIGILIGKLTSALAYLGVLIFATLPIVMICLPLGGVNFYELLAAYVLLITAAGTFGVVTLACSTYFKRTSAALVVSYFVVLPVAIVGVALWLSLGQQAAGVRLFFSLIVAPIAALVFAIAVLGVLRRRLLYPPDLGSEANEVVDEDQEQQQAIGMVIQRDQFPDNLFAPSRRTDLLPDGANPVFDKEMRSEIFSSGTLMARLVIQVSMLLAIPLMAIFLFYMPSMAGWFVGYCMLFNMLVGPVFLAGSVTSERERETLDLLLTTNLTSSAILIPKFLAGLRVSTVLTLFLIPPLIVAGILVEEFRQNWLSLLVYFGLILMTCLTTATLAIFTSVIFRRTSVAMLVSYSLLIVLFCLPLAVKFLASTFYGSDTFWALSPEDVERFSFTSPFAAAMSVPLDVGDTSISSNHPTYVYFIIFAAALNAILLPMSLWLFSRRWREAY